LQQNSVRELVLASAGEREQPEGGESAHSRLVMNIAGSSIYACEVANQIVLSTSVEPGALSGNSLRDWLERAPGPGIQGDNADLLIGDTKAGFKVVGSWKKDFWPPRLFEFGSISFPTGTNPGNRIYAYFTALADSDGRLRIFELSQPDIPSPSYRIPYFQSSSTDPGNY
jgi:hypothetical protein